MLVLPQTIEMTWIGKNKDYYEEKGYEFTGYLTKFNVSVTDLPRKSSRIVTYYCDYCLESNKKDKKTKKYSMYTREREIVEKDCCGDCQQKKREDVFLMKYRVRNPSLLPEVVDKIITKKRHPYVFVKKTFLQAGYILKSSEYKNDSSMLNFICLKHEEAGIQSAPFRSLLDEHEICKECLRKIKTKNTSGDRNPMWRGGTRALNNFLRDKLTDWNRQSYVSCDYKCVVSGVKESDELVVHHLYSFKKIIEEALYNLNLEWKVSIGEYLREELLLIEEEVRKLHEHYPLGVVLKKSIHNQFHSIYGSGNNNSEQFEEFLMDYYPEITLDQISPEKLKKYYPFKTEGTSKFKGVCYVKKQTLHPYIVHIKHYGKSIYVGSFETEVEGAYFYNLKAKELRGQFATVNLLSISEIEFVEKRIKEGKYLKKKIYKNLTRRGNCWEVSFTEQGKYHYVGSYGTEYEGARAFNNYVTKNGINRELLDLDYIA